MLTVGSLFSGIGGLDLGLERAGMRVVWQCEADPFCRTVLAGHWPDVPCYPDVRAVTSPPPVDLLAGGFPCQPVSLAGKRLGASDERWLWPEFYRLIRLLRPRYVLVENVPGLLVGDGMGEVLGDLAAVGYDAEWNCVSACSVGAPHTRFRVFIVAYPNGSYGQAGLGAFADGSQSLQRIDHPEGPSPYRGDWVEGPPDDARMADGLSRWLDWRAPNTRLGNAVVPQVAEYVGRRIVNAA